MPSGVYKHKRGYKKKPLTEEQKKNLIKILIEKTKLENLYIKQRKTAQEIAKIFKCSKATILRRLKKYNIRMRSQPEAILGKYKIIISKEKLEELYLKKRKALYQVASISKCSMGTVIRRLKEFNIPLRNREEAQTKIFIPKEKLKKLYVDEQKSCPKIAQIFGCSSASIQYKLKKFGIPINRIEKTRIARIGTHLAKRTKNKIGEANKEHWQNPEFVKKILNSRHIKPNKAEIKLNSILQEILPDEYGLNVRAEIMVLGGKIPDFVNINGQKKVIELFGSYFHNPKYFPNTQSPEERINYFKQFGWDTLIIWEGELKDKNKLKEKIRRFNADQ